MSITIGEVAKRADVNVQTVRYYERRGLLPEPPRTAAGYRQYDESSVSRIRFIKRAQVLGFSLAEIAELLDLRVHPRSNCDDVRAKAERKRAEIDRKIGDLRRMRLSLEELIRACEARKPTRECPILENLETRRWKSS